MRLLSLLALLILPRPALAARAIMEQTAASKNTIFVDTTNVRVGISTAMPATTLDVSGNAQFGSGAVKSTFTATGNLAIGYGLVASTGIFTSTLTVQGNAFSVGTSSFSVAGGSATVAYRLTAGSFSGGGLSYNNVDNNYSTPETFQSSITVLGNGFSVGTSSFNVAGGSATMAYSTTGSQFLATSISDGGCTSAGLYFGLGPSTNSGLLASSSQSNNLALCGLGTQSMLISNTRIQFGDNTNGKLIINYPQTASSTLPQILALGALTSGFNVNADTPTLISQGVAVAQFGYQPSNGGVVTLPGSAFSVGTSSFTVGGGSATVAYQLSVGSLRIAGSALVVISSQTNFINASKTSTDTTFKVCVGTFTFKTGGSGFCETDITLPLGNTTATSTSFIGARINGPNNFNGVTVPFDGAQSPPVNTDVGSNVGLTGGSLQVQPISFHFGGLNANTFYNGCVGIWATANTANITYDAASYQNYVRTKCY